MKYILDNKEYDVEIIKKRNKKTYVRVKEDLTIHITTNFFATKKEIKNLLDNNHDFLRGAIEKRIKEILQTEEVDKTRLAQEVVIYADKCSVEEEITRMKSHILQLRNLIETNEPTGKKMDFLIQEMNRETQIT